jgi:hypothetical protein
VSRSMQGKVEVLGLDFVSRWASLLQVPSKNRRDAWNAQLRVPWLSVGSKAENSKDERKRAGGGGRGMAILTRFCQHRKYKQTDWPVGQFRQNSAVRHQISDQSEYLNYQPQNGLFHS